jgi:MFS transporter, FLVCR family, MFS-domain-containing protein 7
VLVGITAPCFQVIGPRYAEVWFDLQGRATTTMIVAISDPLGTAIGQIVAPFITNIRFGILLLALVTTLTFPLAFAVLPSPPKPPTYSGSLISSPISQTLRAAFGYSRPGEQFLTKTERLDFFILFFVFGVLVAGTSSFSVFIAQIFQPYGYSAITSGIMGGAFLLSGLVAAILSAPIFDRVLVHHLAKTVKVCLPALGVVWIGLIFAGLFAFLIGCLTRSSFHLQ